MWLLEGKKAEHCLPEGRVQDITQSNKIPQLQPLPASYFHNWDSQHTGCPDYNTDPSCPLKAAQPCQDLSPSPWGGRKASFSSPH